MRHEISCKQVAKAILTEVDLRENGELQKKIEKHLSFCDNCKTFKEQIDFLSHIDVEDEISLSDEKKNQIKSEIDKL